MVGLHFHSCEKLEVFPPYHFFRTKNVPAVGSCHGSAFPFLPPSTFVADMKLQMLGVGFGVPHLPLWEQSWGGLQELGHSSQGVSRDTGLLCLLWWADAPEREELRVGIQVRKLLAPEKKDRWRRYSCPCL